VSPFVLSEDILLSQNIPESILPPASPDLAYLHELLLETPSDLLSSQVAPNSLVLHGAPGSSSFPPQIPTSVDDRAFYAPNWRKIPQEVYNHGRKQWGFTPSEPILFPVNGCPGLNMGDALRKRFTGLDGRDDLVLQDARGAISCRLLVRLSC